MRKQIIGAVVATLALAGSAVAFGQGSSKAIDDGREDFAFPAPGPPGIGGEPEVAIAVAGGPPFAFGDESDDDFAEDLAAELGLSADEVEEAIDAVAEDRAAEHRRQMAEAIAAHLEGVTVEEIEAALAVAEEQAHKGIEDGEPPAPGEFTETLASELGVSEEEIEDALASAHEDIFDEHRDELEQRLDEAVEDGRLSDERADAIRERLQGDPLPIPELGTHERRFELGDAPPLRGGAFVLPPL